MHLYFGSDHAGFLLKEALKKHAEAQQISHTDIGCFSQDSCDYPLIAREVAEKISEYPDSMGVLICGSGIGMSIAANRFKGVRAAECCNEEYAKLARQHNNANVLCMGARLVDMEKAKKMMDVFLHTPFEGGRHERRVAQLDQ